ncbi:MAG TPA: YkgJ family cysteine cluster protein [Vicinamibacterales bacterium]|nr:YkgJ family cysteine cluster protein [Vicinamibacterales bacterium]
MTRVLSFHATYRCANSGACCTADWPIPVEADRLSRLQAALASSNLRARARVAEPLRFLTGAPKETPAFLATRDHACAFYDGAAGQPGCRIHRALGHEALPLACRQFPRVVVHDPRGVSVTLSHYCPTAAAMLGRDAPVRIVTDAPSFPNDGEYVGLDATGTLPPLLAEGVLMDWDSWWECERLGVELLGNFEGAPADALARLAGAVSEMQTWTPDAPDPLIDHVQRSFAGAASAPARPFASPREASASPRALNRFLAAHAFANWAVHGRAGISGWLRSIETAHALVAAGASVRDADLRLRHLADASTD